MAGKVNTGIRIVSFVAILATIPAMAEAQSGMASGAKVYIDGEREFAIYLTAAIREKHVNVVVTADRDKADYVLEATSDHIKKTGLKPSIVSDWTAPVLPQVVKAYDAASVRLVNVKTSDVVFAYSVDRNNTAHGRQTAAESCAKHLKDAIATGLNAKGAQGATTADKTAAWPWHADPALGFGIY